MKDIFSWIIHPSDEMKNSLIIIIAVATAAILVAAGAIVMLNKDNGNNDNGQATVIDGLGRPVTIKSTDRIASTSATVTEIICGIGGYSKLAGVTVDTNPYKVKEYIMGIPDDNYPKIILDGLASKKLVNMGGMYNIAAESILISKPDLVIMGGYFNSENTITQLGALGIPVVICKDDNSLENIYFNIRLIGKVIGKESEAETLVGQMEFAISKVVNWTKSLNATPKSVAVFMMYGSSYGTYACGTEYLMGTPILTMLGCTNAFSGISGKYQIVSTESIVAVNPEIVIDITPGSAADLSSIKTSPVIKNITAAKNDRIYGAFDACNTAVSLTTQGFVNAVAIMAMFMYEDHLNFEIDHYMGDDYPDYLKKFWTQINS